MFQRDHISSRGASPLSGQTLDCQPSLILRNGVHAAMTPVKEVLNINVHQLLWLTDIGVGLVWHCSLSTR